MKWTKPGHEFDDMALCIMDADNEYYLWGAGRLGEICIELIGKDINIAGFIDSDLTKKNTTHCGYRVFSPDEVTFNENNRVIITVFEYTQGDLIDEKLASMGLVKEYGIIHFDTFYAVYSMYRYNKLVYSYFALSVTEKCTLRCKECYMHIPYIENPRNYSLESLKTDIDLFFEFADYVYDFQIFGGEPMLYPQLGELVEYIGSKYRNKIKKLWIMTNATIVPSSELMEIFSCNRVSVTLTNYTVSPAFKRKQRLEEIRNVLDSYPDVEYMEKADGIWFKIGGSPKVAEQASEEELIRYYNTCLCNKITVKDNRMYSCERYSSDVWAGRCKENKYSYLDLSKKEEVNKKVLMEFALKYTELGYIPYCKKCYSVESIRERLIPAAEQLD